MDIQKVDMYITANAKYFKPEQIQEVRNKLISLPDDKYPILMSLQLQDPTTCLLFSIFLGSLGIDRFVIGDIGMGILKLLTVGCCGVLTIVDWFLIQDKARDINYKKLLTIY